MQLYSKTLAIASRTVWTDQEVIPVAITIPGLPVLGTAFAPLKIAGRDMVLQGFRIDIQSPVVNYDSTLTVALADGDGAVITPKIYGQVTGQYGHADVTCQVGLPSGSYWQFVLSDAPQDAGSALRNFAGSDLTVTYLLSYSNTTVVNPNAVYRLNYGGIGFWTISNDFVIKTNS